MKTVVGGIDRLTRLFGIGEPDMDNFTEVHKEVFTQFVDKNVDYRDGYCGGEEYYIRIHMFKRIEVARRANGKHYINNNYIKRKGE